MEVAPIAIMNLTPTGIFRLNIENVIIVTIGRCIKYIQYAPSDINLNLGL